MLLHNTIEELRKLFKFSSDSDGFQKPTSEFHLSVPSRAYFLYFVADIGSSMDYRSVKLEDGEVNSLSSRVRIRTPLYSPSPLKSILIRNQSISPTSLILQRQLYIRANDQGTSFEFEVYHTDQLHHTIVESPPIKDDKVRNYFQTNSFPQCIFQRSILSTLGNKHHKLTFVSCIFTGGFDR